MDCSGFPFLDWCTFVPLKYFNTAAVRFSFGKGIFPFIFAFVWFNLAFLINLIIVLIILNHINHTAEVNKRIYKCWYFVSNTCYFFGMYSCVFHLMLKADKTINLLNHSLLWRFWNADPDRPKNDKATILSDTIQLLKDLTSQVSKLKEEYATLNEESREVIFLFDKLPVLILLGLMKIIKISFHF